MASTLQQAKTSSRPSMVDGARRHLLDLDDFSQEELDLVMSTTDAMREVLSRDIKKVPTLRGKVIVTLFYEVSTRTRVSFEEAGKLLSADVINVSSSGSSVEKGESLLNTVRTLQATGTDIIVVRHPHSGAPYFMARNLERAGVINGGDGWHAHPTQALLDLYTMKRHLGSVIGAKVVIVGDVTHSRVARSKPVGFADGGSAGSAVRASYAVAPGVPFRRAPQGWTPLWLCEGGDQCRESHQRSGRCNASASPVGAPGGGASPHAARIFENVNGITKDRLTLAKPNALVMHPGPMNEGVEISPDVAHGAQSLIEEQVHNGVAVRMALLYLLMGSRQRPQAQEGQQ